MEKALGIDLGTTFSVAAVMENGKARIVPNAEGKSMTPSVVARTLSGRMIVGDPARKYALVHPERAVFSIKRGMGTDHRVVLDGRAYSPQEISSHILARIRRDAENHLGCAVKRAVITVPAYFSDGQRQATREAGALAGLEVMRIVSEPTAASLSYGLDEKEDQTVVVWDLGGGTFDVSVLSLGQGFHQVLAVSGDTRLGGDDWDRRLVDHVAGRMARERGWDPRPSPRAMEKLRQACERAKRELSRAPVAKIVLSHKPEGGKSTVRTSVDVDRATFEALTSDLNNELSGPTLRALSDAGLAPEEVDRVVLVGGSTRMPAVRGLVEEMFGKKPYTRLNPDEVVGIGAAIQAGILTNEVRDVVLVDVTPLSLGIETEKGLFARLIGRNTSIPATASQIFVNARDDQTEMDIHVLQGEREMAGDNISLGRFQLTGLCPLPRGTARVEVTFRIDVNGVVKVRAEDLHTESEAVVRFDASHLLPEEEVRDLIREAEANAATDAGERAAVVKAIVEAGEPGSEAA